MKQCPECKKMTSDNETTCPFCGSLLDITVCCPYCKSMDTTTTAKAPGWFLEILLHGNARWNVWDKGADISKTIVRKKCNSCGRFFKEKNRKK